MAAILNGVTAPAQCACIPEASLELSFIGNTRQKAIGMLEHAGRERISLYFAEEKIDAQRADSAVFVKGFP